MKKYLAVYRFKSDSGVKTFTKEFSDITKHTIYEELRGNGYKVVAILSEKQINNAKQDIANPFYFLVNDYGLTL